MNNYPPHKVLSVLNLHLVPLRAFGHYFFLHTSHPVSHKPLITRQTVEPLEDRNTTWITLGGMQPFGPRRFDMFQLFMTIRERNAHSLHYASQDEERWSNPQRGPDGRYQPVEQLAPMDQEFIGGFMAPPNSPYSQGEVSPPPIPPRPPPKDKIYPPTPSNGGHPERQPSWSETQYASSMSSEGAPYPTYQLAHLSAVERSQNLRVARMNPHLQFMAGPLLRYDTVDRQGVWHGAAMIVSKYNRYPSCTSAH